MTVVTGCADSGDDGLDYIDGVMKVVSVWEGWLPGCTRVASLFHTLFLLVFTCMFLLLSF